MDGLATASPHIGAATASQGQQLPLTFTYTTPADIQGLAEPAVRGGVGGVPRQHPVNLHAASHGVQQIQGIQQVQRQSGMVVATQPTGLQMNASRQGMPVNVHHYDTTIEALIQQQEQRPHLSHPQPHSQSQPQPQTPSHIQSVVPVRLPSTPDSPNKERPRIKGRMTPYAFFVQQRRDYYRQQGVPVQFTPFSKECSSLWKTMSDEEKQKYQKMAEEDRERYRREVTGFEKPLAKDGTRRGRRKKEPGQPKRNMCAFLHFCSVKRPKLKQENPSLSVGAMARQLSSAWKLMTPEQKKPYNEMAERDKQRYEQQKQAYEAGYSAAFLNRGNLSPSAIQAGGSGSGTGVGLMVGPIPPRHRRRKKDPDMPRRNMSAFMFYSLENRPNIKAQNPEFGVGKLAQRLAQHWKLMNTTQKHPYQLMARKDKERYESELKAYKKGMYTGTGLTARQVAHSVTGRTIPPPATHSNSTSSSRPTSQTSQMPQLPSPVDEEGSPPTGDELEQLCEFYQ